MTRFFSLLLLLLVTNVLTAQTSAFATASATILNSVGTEELTGTEVKNLSQTPQESISAPERVGKGTEKQAGFAAFRILGNEVVYSLNVALHRTPPLMGMDALPDKGTSVAVKPMSGIKDAYVLGSLIESNAAGTEKYNKERVAEITVNFN